MATDHQLEVLSDAFDAVTRAGDFETTSDPRGYIKAEQRLLDACIDAGMPYDHADPSAWAATKIWLWHNAGPVAGLWAGSGYARNYSLVEAA